MSAYDNLKRSFKGVSFFYAQLSPEQIASFQGKTVVAASNFIKPYIFGYAELITQMRRNRSDALTLLVLGPHNQTTPPSLFNVAFEIHPEQELLSPVEFPLHIRRVAGGTDWSIKRPNATKITELVPSSGRRFTFQNVIQNGANNIGFMTSSNNDLMQGWMDRSVLAPSMSEEQIVELEALMPTLMEADAMETDDEVFLRNQADRTNEGRVNPGDNNSPLVRNPIVPVVSQDTVPTNQNNIGSTGSGRVDNQPPSIPSISKDNIPTIPDSIPGTSSGMSGNMSSNMPTNNQVSTSVKRTWQAAGFSNNPSERTIVRAGYRFENNRWVMDESDPIHHDKVPKFKLDNENFYKNAMRNIDVNKDLFKKFFSRNFHNNIILDMNNRTYSEIMSFDAVHILNHGAYMIKMNTTSCNTSLIAALTCCEVLMPAVPDNLFYSREESQLEVRRYGTALFSETAIVTTRHINDFINAIEVSTAGTYEGQIKAHLLSLAGVTSIASLKSSLTLEEIKNLPANSNALLPLDIVMTLLSKYLDWRNKAESSGEIKERMIIIYSIHLGIAKMGRMTPIQCNKFQKEIKQIIGTDVGLDADIISTIWRYCKPFINESVALKFFSKLRHYVPEEHAIHLHHSFLYAAHQEMTCMKFIHSAMRKFPDFPWFMAQSAFKAAWNKFTELSQEMWNRPFMAYSGIPAKFGANNYLRLAFLSWRLLTTRGSAQDMAAKAYPGFRDKIDITTQRKVWQLLNAYETRVVSPIDETKACTLEERRQQFDSIEQPVQRFAIAAEIFNEKLLQLTGSEDLIAVANECMNEATATLLKVRDEMLMPISEGKVVEPIGVKPFNSSDGVFRLSKKST